MKRVKDMVSNIQNNILEDLERRGETVRYSHTANLFYEGQTPVVAYLLLSGNIHLLKNKKIKDTLGSGALIGVRELMTGQPVPFSAQIMPETKVCFLSKSDIFEILEADSDLSQEIDQLIQAS